MNLSKAELFFHTGASQSERRFPLKSARNISLQSAIISRDAQPGHHRSDRRIGRSLRFDRVKSAQWERRRVGDHPPTRQSLLLERGYERRNSSRSGAPHWSTWFSPSWKAPGLEIVRGAGAAASETGLTVSLTSLSEGADEERSWLDHIGARVRAASSCCWPDWANASRPSCTGPGLPFAVVDPRENRTRASRR